MTAGQVALLLLGATILLALQFGLATVVLLLSRRLSELEKFVLTQHEEEVAKLKQQLNGFRSYDAAQPNRRQACCVAKPGLPCAWSGWIPSPKTGVQFRTCAACGTGQVEPLPGGPQGRQVGPFQPPPTPATLTP